MNSNRPTPRNTVIKMANVKERILKAAGETQSINYKRIPIRISDDFSTETLEARKEWQDILKIIKGKNLEPKIPYPARISFKIEGKVKIL